MDQATVEREAHELRREISNVETQIKSLRDYIAAQERNLRGAAESVRGITERSLAEARGDLYVKELRLQQIRQELDDKQRYLTRLAAIDRKRQDIQTLERERDRVNSLLMRAQDELQQLIREYQALSGPTVTPDHSLIFTSGARFPLGTKQDVLIGCADPSVFPDVDLTPLGGTTSGVSRRHAMLRHTNGMWTITDLSSTNGTFVNTTRIAPNTPTPLHDQDTLRFGSLDAVFAVQHPAPNKTTRLS